MEVDGNLAVGYPQPVSCPQEVEQFDNDDLKMRKK
jgi:hypothetical protein